MARWTTCLLLLFACSSSPAIGPTSYRVYEDLATALVRSGDATRAAAYLRKSLELNPSNLDAADALEAIQKKIGANR
jgi:hypothetical protein